LHFVDFVPLVLFPSSFFSFSFFFVWRDVAFMILHFSFVPLTCFFVVFVVVVYKKSTTLLHCYNAQTCEVPKEVPLPRHYYIATMLKHLKSPRRVPYLHTITLLQCSNM
jgi:hypothetical protein